MSVTKWPASPSPRQVQQVRRAPKSTPSHHYPAAAADHLIAIAAELRAMTMPDPVSKTTSINDVVHCGRGGHALHENGWPKNCAAIYRVRMDASSVAQLWKLACAEDLKRKQAAAAHKANGKGTKLAWPYQMSRLVGWSAGKTCLYVGKTDDLIDRQREHLGPHSAISYAMHLGMWAPASLHAVPITIEYWPLAELDLSKDAIQALEDAIWRDSRPVFGKQGPK